MSYRRLIHFSFLIMSTVQTLPGEASTVKDEVEKYIFQLRVVQQVQYSIFKSWLNGGDPGSSSSSRISNTRRAKHAYYFCFYCLWSDSLHVTLTLDSAKHTFKPNMRHNRTAQHDFCDFFSVLLLLSNTKLHKQQCVIASNVWHFNCIRTTMEGKTDVILSHKVIWLLWELIRHHLSRPW